MASILSRFGSALRHGWNVFDEKEEADRLRSFDRGESFGVRPDRTRRNMSNDRSIITSVFTRIAVDAAAIDIQHVKTDEDGIFQKIVLSGLQYCLSVEANLDQPARAFRQDFFMTLLEKGTVAVVPTDTTVNPTATPEAGGYDIKTIRVAEVVRWMPNDVRVNVYNEKTGRRVEMDLPKKMVAVVENPFYSVMNEQNGTLQRLLRKLSLLDSIDEQLGSGKLDMIIQLPFTIRTDVKRKEAEQRRKDIEDQLRGSQYGVAYADATEKITQLNRPLENNMVKQIEVLTEMLYSQLGLTKDVFNGTAAPAVMTSYYNRTTEPLLAAFSEALTRNFLSKTARSQGHKVTFYRDPFKGLAVEAIAQVTDVMSRNEIMSANEVRSAIGLRPSKEASANELRNKNLPADQTVSPGAAVPEVPPVDAAASTPPLS